MVGGTPGDEEVGARYCCWRARGRERSGVDDVKTVEKRSEMSAGGGWKRGTEGA